MLHNRTYYSGVVIAFIATLLGNTYTAFSMPEQTPAVTLEQEFITLDNNRIEQKKHEWQAASTKRRLKGVAYVTPAALCAVASIITIGYALISWITSKNSSNQQIANGTDSEKKDTDIEKEYKKKKYKIKLQEYTNKTNASWWNYFLKKVITQDLLKSFVYFLFFTLMSGLALLIVDITRQGFTLLFTPLGENDFLVCIKSFLSNVSAYQKSLSIFALTQKNTPPAGSIEAKIDMYAARNFLADHRAFIESTEHMLALLDILLKRSKLNTEQQPFFEKSLQTIFGLVNDLITTTVIPVVGKKSILDDTQIALISQKFANEMKHFVNVAYGALYEKTGNLQMTA